MTEEWQRLDRRMLLVHPVDELRRFLPALVGIAVLGTAGGNLLPAVAAVLLPIVVGVVRYLTTTYRIAEGRIELRRGLLSRQLLSTPLDRVRTVDLTASLVHRLLGLATVRIGTGSAAADAERLELNALAAGQAARLRGVLLAAAEEPAVEPGAVDERRAAPAVARFSWRWLRYAPFTAQGVIVIGALLGAIAQAAETLDLQIRLTEEDLPAPSVVLVAGAVLALVLVALVFTMAGYVVSYWQFTLERRVGSWRLRRGLLTVRETTIDIARVAGASLGESLALRLAGGARLSAIVTGVDRSERGSEVLVPPAPAAQVRAAAVAVVGRAPVDVPLRSHGAAATRRRYLRALIPSVALAGALVVLVAAGLPTWLLLLAVLAVAGGLGLAADRARGLGHALTDRYVVTRSGSLLRRRDMLARDHVIGWTFRDTWFQRRVGLTSLSATTAGGRGFVTVLDVPVDDGVALADAAVPLLVGQFVRSV